jgi:hypothetical protein
MPYLSEPIPTYNEGENAARLCGKLSVLDFDADILYCGNCSRESAGEIVDEFTPEFASIRLVRRPGKNGIGSAYR